jgi:hypothetical protein
MFVLQSGVVRFLRELASQFAQILDVKGSLRSSFETASTRKYTNIKSDAADLPEKAAAWDLAPLVPRTLRDAWSIPWRRL